MMTLRMRTRSAFESRQLARGLALLCAGGILMAANSCSDGRRNAPETDAWLEIKGRRLSVEIADTPRRQKKGLGGRDSLAWNHGMYFEYSQPAFYGFWMKGMRFSIDIIWLRDGRIIGLDANVPFEKGGNGPSLRPAELVDAVLEVPAGYAAANGWQVGDPVLIERIKGN
jgi:uncharacterized membrane protein (UPF0127 family)